MVRKNLRSPGRGANASEVCDNPWNSGCRSRDIVLYIYAEGRRHPICRDCWKWIVSEGRTWG